MNNIKESAYAGHEEILLLLPWLTTGTLKGAELERVQNHLKVCLTCRRELSTLETLSVRIQESSSPDVSAVPSFERLMLKIGQAAPAEIPVARAAQPAKAPQWFGQWMATWFGMPSVRFACAATVLLMTLPLVLRDSSLGQSDALYHTLAMPGSMARLEENDLRVVFAQPLSPQQLNVLLSQIDGVVVNGPSTEGIYTIRIGGKSSGGQKVHAALSQLRQMPVVMLAEPALPPDAN